MTLGVLPSRDWSSPRLGVTASFLGFEEFDLEELNTSSFSSPSLIILFASDFMYTVAFVTF